MDDVVVTDELTIPAAELEWRFGPSGGPGGQHANRANTRVELRFDVSRSPTLDDASRARLLAGLADRLVDGSLRVVVDQERSQARNRRIAQDRLAGLLRTALRPPPPPRRRTRPSAAARQRRLDAKRRRGEVKRRRRPPEPE